MTREFTTNCKDGKVTLVLTTQSDNELISFKVNDRDILPIICISGDKVLYCGSVIEKLRH